MKNFVCIFVSFLLAGCCTSFPIGPGDDSEDVLIKDYEPLPREDFSGLKSDIEKLKKNQHSHFWK